MATELISLSNRLADAVERAGPRIVAVQARPRINSSGIVWGENLVLTSSEGIRFEEGIQVLFADGRVAPARLRGIDRRTDLALLEADTGSIPAAEFASDTTLKPGQLVLAVGRTSASGPIASFGIISGVSNEWMSWRGGKLTPFVRLDLSAYPTSSGGALIDASGAMLGLVSTGLSRSSVLAVTRTTLERVVQKLRDHGYVGRGYLGIALQPVALPGDLQSKLQLAQDRAIMILGVEPNGPAAAGLILGDILLAAGGRTLSEPEALAESIESVGIGQLLDLRVLRAGAIHNTEIRVGERPRRGK